MRNNLDVSAPWTFPFNIGLSILPRHSSMSCLDSPPGFSAGKLQALQLILMAVFGAVDYPLASCMLFRFLEIRFEMIVGL